MCDRGGGQHRYTGATARDASGTGGRVQPPVGGRRGAARGWRGAGISKCTGGRAPRLCLTARHPPPHGDRESSQAAVLAGRVPCRNGRARGSNICISALGVLSVLCQGPGHSKVEAAGQHSGLNREP